MISSIAAMPQAQLTVLVVDDDFLMQRVIVGTLSRLGHTGVVVENGEQAIECLSKRKFDLVLLDVMMPVMDGLETLFNIRQVEANSENHQRIIMLTGHALPGDAERLRQAGADGYISKPIKPELLIKELSRVMGR